MQLGFQFEQNQFRRILSTIKKLFRHYQIPNFSRPDKRVTSDAFEIGGAMTVDDDRF